MAMAKRKTQDAAAAGAAIDFTQAWTLLDIAHKAEIDIMAEDFSPLDAEIVPGVAPQ